MTMREYWFWLCNIPDIGNIKKGKLIKATGSPEELYKTNSIYLKQIDTISNRDIEIIEFSKKNFNINKQLDRMEKADIKFVYYGQKEYPSRLNHIYDRPYGLYYKGALPDENMPAVSIVGSRAGSEYGFMMAEQFGEKLARAGINIISGMARGVDSHGHAGAIKGGGSTFAVLGCGIDMCYPRENIQLYEDIIRNGGVISEYFIGEEPLSWHFPQRNRIISALSDKVLVMEAKEKSGSFITVEWALEQGKDVYALPGRVTDRLSMGCNRLIKSGAGILTTPEELISDMGFTYLPQNKICEKVNNTLEKDLQVVYSELDLSLKNIQTIIEETHYDEQQVMQSLLRLQLMDLVDEPVKNHYVRKC